MQPSAAVSLCVKQRICKVPNRGLLAPMTVGSRLATPVAAQSEGRCQRERLPDLTRFGPSQPRPDRPEAEWPGRAIISLKRTIADRKTDGPRHILTGEM